MNKQSDPLLKLLGQIVVLCVKFLAVIMVLVIMMTILDVIILLYQEVMAPTPTLFLNIENISTVFGAFLMVLIGIEIFLNIIFYLKEDAIHVPLVLSTALTAVARKVIILDYKTSSPHYIYATAAVIFAVGIVYWLVTKMRGTDAK